MDTWRSKTFLLLSVATVLTLVSSALVISLSIGNMPEESVLHFTRDGIDRFGPPTELWWILSIAGVGMIIDLLVGAVLYRRDRTLSYLLVGAAPLMGLLLLIAVLTIIGNN
jgi:hypothetical protein